METAIYMPYLTGASPTPGDVSMATAIYVSRRLCRTLRVVCLHHVRMYCERETLLSTHDLLAPCLRVDLMEFRVDLVGFRADLVGFRILLGFRVDLGVRADLVGFRADLVGFHILLSFRTSSDFAPTLWACTVKGRLYYRRMIACTVWACTEACSKS